MQSCPGTYYVIVIEDVELAKIVACGTLVVEQKFIHDTAVVCFYTQATFVELFYYISFFLYKRGNYDRLFFTAHIITIICLVCPRWQQFQEGGRVLNKVLYWNTPHQGLNP